MSSFTAPDPATVPRTLAGRGRDFLTLAVLLSGAPCMALMFVVVAPVLSSLAAHFGAGADGALIAQLIMTLPGIGIILGGPTTGWLVERAGIRPALFGSLIIYSLAGVAGLVIDDFRLMLATRLLLGWSAAGISTATMAFIGLRYEGDARARILGYQSAIGACGGLVGLLAAGGLGEVAGWRAPFALYLLGAVVLLFALVAIPRAHGHSAREPAQSGSFLLPLWPVYVLIVLVFAAVFMGAVQIAFVLAADGTTSPAQQSWVLACSSLSSAIGAWAYGRVRSHLGSYSTLAVCLALLAAGFMVVGLSHSAFSTASGCVISGLGGGAIGPYVAGVLLDRAPEAVRGRAVGFMYTAIYLGDFANPLLVTPLRSVLGIHGAFLAVAATLGAAAVYAAARPVYARQRVRRRRRLQ